MLISSMHDAVIDNVVNGAFMGACIEVAQLSILDGDPLAIVTKLIEESLLWVSF